MATQNANNQKFTNNADGFDLAGGTTARKITLSGADVDIVGSGTAVITFPSATSTLASLDLAETLTNKTLTDPKIETSINAQTGTTYTLVLADASKHVSMSNASANTLTIPPNSAVSFPVGTKVFITQGGAGSTTIAAGAGVTINAPSTVTLAIDEQHESRVCQKTATDTWLLI